MIVVPLCGVAADGTELVVELVVFVVVGDDEDWEDSVSDVTDVEEEPIETEPDVGVIVGFTERAELGTVLVVPVIDTLALPSRTRSAYRAGTVATQDPSRRASP